MKRLIGLVLISVVMTGVASEALGQIDEYVRRPHQMTVWVDAGLSMASQPADFKERWNTTWPFSGGIGVSAFSWLEIAGGLSYGKFGISEIPAKSALEIETTASIEGGSVTLLQYYGSARFIAVPSQRVNPYAEVRVGLFSATMEDLEVSAARTQGEETPGFTRSTEDVDGIHFSFGGGLQYALNDSWSAYSAFMWTMNLNEDFTPSALVRPESRSEESLESNHMQFGTIIVGILIRLSPF
jgi:opacity protein-like surface antigen